MKKDKKLILEKEKKHKNIWFEILLTSCEIIFKLSPIMFGLLAFGLSNMLGFLVSLVLLTGFFSKEFGFREKK
ncbi:MAG: hypothetical protein ACOC1P_00340 [Minisyncoccales bacterium]